MKQRIVKRLFFWSLVYIEVVSQPSQNELEAGNFPTFSNIIYYLLPTWHLGLKTLKIAAQVLPLVAMVVLPTTVKHFDWASEQSSGGKWVLRQ